MEKRLEFEIIGESALLTNNPSSMGDNATQQAPVQGGNKIPSPEEEAESKLYVVDGKYCFPGIGIRNGIVKAAANWSAPTGGKKAKMRPLVSHILVEPELMPILTIEGKPHRDYVIDRRRVVIKGRGGIIRSRPKFERWGVRFTVVYDDTILFGKRDVIYSIFENIINDAGKRLGLGDYRPEKTGWFGRYTIREIHSTKKKA